MTRKRLQGKKAKLQQRHRSDDTDQEPPTKRRKFSQVSDAAQLSSSPVTASLEPLRPAPTAQRPRRLAVPISRKSSTSHAKAATSPTQPQQPEIDRSSLPKKLTDEEKGCFLPWVQGRPSFRRLCRRWPRRFKNRKYAMMALDLVEPEGSHSSPAYRLSMLGDSKADEVIELDWMESGADNDFFALEKTRCTSNDTFFEIYEDLGLDCLVRKTMDTHLRKRHYAWATVVEALLGAIYLDAGHYFQSLTIAMEILRWVMRELGIYPRVDTIPFTALQDTDLEKHLRDPKKFKHASEQFRANFRVANSDPEKMPEFPAFEELDFAQIDLAKKGRYQWTVQYVTGWKFTRRLRKVRKAKKSKKLKSSNASVAEIGDIQSDSIDKTSDKENIPPSSSERTGDSDIVSLSAMEDATSPTTPPTSPVVDKAFEKKNATPTRDEDAETLTAEAGCDTDDIDIDRCCACSTLRSGLICVTCPVHPV